MIHNEKLLRTALKYETYSGKTEALKIICETLHAEGIIESPEPSGSTAMCFEENDPDISLIIKILNQLDYEIRG